MNKPSTNQADLGQAYQSFRNGLYRYLRAHVEGDEVAEDLLHEVFLKALAAGRGGARPQHLSGWLYAIARSTVVDHYRSLRPLDALPEDLAAPVLDEQSSAAGELKNCLRPLVDQLPERYRSALVAAEWEGQRLPLLAKRWNLSLSAVKSRVSRGRKLLRERLRECCRIETSATGGVLGFEPNLDGNCEADCGGC